MASTISKPALEAFQTSVTRHDDKVKPAPAVPVKPVLTSELHLSVKLKIRSFNLLAAFTDLPNRGLPGEVIS